MKLTFILTAFLFMLTSCNEYISKKRDGLKPYPDTERQAQEDQEKHQ